MQQITRKILWAVIFGALNLFAQAQDSPSSPQKLAADETFPPDSSVPVLTVDEAIAQAVANHGSLRIADRIRPNAGDELAANRTTRLRNTQITAPGGRLLTKPSVTSQQGSLGVCPVTGPSPATNQTIHVAGTPAGAAFVSITQPLSTQYGWHLEWKTPALGVEATRQDQPKTRLEVVDQVRRAYHAVAEAQSALDSLEASLPYYEESRLPGAENGVTDAKGQVASASERLNDLMGRDIRTQFRVTSIRNTDAELEAPEALETTEPQNRPELKASLPSASTTLAQQDPVSTVPALTIPVLTIDEAVALAVKGNRQVRSAALGVDAAQQETAAQRTSRWPQFQTYVLGGEALRPISFTIPEGALGVYPSTGPIPGKNSQVTTPRQFTGLVFAQASQPLSQLWNIHLSVISSRIAEDLARETLEQQRQDTAHSVRDLYYQIAETQTQIGDAESNERYLVELNAETDRNLVQLAALKGDSLSVRAKLSQQRYQLLSLRDTEQTQKESLNRLLGRDLSTPFSVEVQPMPTPEEIDLQAARREAIEQRTEVRQARLQAKNAEIAVRQERAQYIPDVSATLTYVTLPNVSFAPQNVLQAGFLFKWQPFDWGQKKHKSESLRDSANQATLSEQDAEQQVILDVNAKFRSLTEARALLDATALSEEAEREKLRVVVNRYGQKAALLSDVLQQEEAISAAGSNYENAVAAFWRAKAGFDRSLGRE